MTGCERMETLISSWLDGEIEPNALLPVTDHMADCAACREFYRASRTLDDALLASGLADPGERADESLWRRIEEARGSEAPVTVHPAAATGPAATASPAALRSWGAWAGPVAAGLVLAAGLWAVGRAPLPARQAVSGPRAIEVTLGQDRDAMSEERFIDLAREVLHADPRYHREMLGLMYAATRAAGEGESAPEGRTLRTGGEPATESEILDESLSPDRETGGERGGPASEWL